MRKMGVELYNFITKIIVFTFILVTEITAGKNILYKNIFILIIIMECN